MVMDTIQVRMSKGLIEKLDKFVETGMYANRSDVIRAAVRQIDWAAEAGTIPNRGNAVKQVRKARAVLSRQFKG
jgi:Arc/MetJ-type ribon-helix-helix transcriptional regulator